MKKKLSYGKIDTRCGCLDILKHSHSHGTFSYWLEYDFPGRPPCWLSATHLNRFNCGFHLLLATVLPLVPTWRMHLVCRLHTLSTGNDRRLRHIKLGWDVKTGESYLWGKFSHLQRRGFSLRTGNIIHLSGAREGSENLLLESIADTEALSRWEKWPLTEDSLRDTGDTSSPTRHQVAMVLQHHRIPVRVLLIGGQELPLLPRELHSHVVIYQGFLSQHGPV